MLVENTRSAQVPKREKSVEEKIRRDRRRRWPQRPDGGGLPRARRTFDLGTRTARHYRRLLRDGGNRGWVSRVDYLLYCKHAASHRDSRSRSCCARVADGCVRSRACCSVSRWTGGGLVGGS